jgi:ABC-type multidrug transport system permease subunit
MYWFIGLSSTASQFFTYYLISYLIGFAGSSMGLMLGSIVSDAKSVSAITPAILLPFFLFSGLFKNSGNYPDWIGWNSIYFPYQVRLPGIRGE